MNAVDKLFLAIMKRNDALAREAIAEGASINGCNLDGQTVWSFVISRDSARIALQLGADPNLVDAAQRSSLYWAVFVDDGDIIDLLIENGAKIPPPDWAGKYNLLHEAAGAGEVRAIVALLKYVPKSMLAEKDVLGQTPQEVALANGHLECAELLRESTEPEGALIKE